MSKHIVKQGEHLSRIAAEAGFSDYETLWNHPDNAALKRKRKSPHILMPGDVVSIPERIVKQQPTPTTQHHKFKVTRTPLKLRMVLEGFGREPLAHAKLDVHVDGQVHKTTTDARGLFEVPISPSTEQALLIFEDPNVPFPTPCPILIGHLHPVEEPSGQEARLRNLGYFLEPSDAAAQATALHDAVEEFQCDFGLTVDGICGPRTQAKLKEVHGC